MPIFFPVRVCAHVCVYIFPLKYPNWKPGGTHFDAASVEFSGLCYSSRAVCVCACLTCTQKHTHENTVCWPCALLSLLMINERPTMYLCSPSPLSTSCNYCFFSTWLVSHLFASLSHSVWNRVCACVLMCSQVFWFVHQCYNVCACGFSCACLSAEWG